MNEVSIIINRVRYDEVEAECTYSCEICDLKDKVNEILKVVNKKEKHEKSI